MAGGTISSSSGSGSGMPRRSCAHRWLTWMPVSTAVLIVAASSWRFSGFSTMMFHSGTGAFGPRFRRTMGRRNCSVIVCSRPFASDSIRSQRTWLWTSPRA